MDIVTVLERACERHADRPALSREGTTVSYAEVGERVPVVAAALADLGVGAGSTVGVCSPDSIEAWLAIFAVWRLGALPALIDARTPDDRLGYFVGDMDPAVVVSDDENRPRLAEILGIEAARLADVVGAGGTATAPADHHESSPLFLSYTSGTTGDPKGVVLTSGPVTLGTACSAERLGYGMNDVLVATTPVASSFQLVASAMPALHSGAHVVLAAGHTPSEVWEDIAAHGGTVLVAYPLTLADVVGLAKDTEPTHGLRLALSGGSPLAPRIKRDYREHLGIPLAESYGQSELGGFMVLGTPGDETAPEGFAGRPLPDRLAFVAGADNRELPTGSVGEVVVAEGFFGEYRNKPEAYAKTTAGGVLHTGDVGSPRRRGTSRSWAGSRRPTPPGAGAASSVRWRTPPTTTPPCATPRSCWIEATISAASWSCRWRASPARTKSPTTLRHVYRSPSTPRACTSSPSSPEPSAAKPTASA